MSSSSSVSRRIKPPFLKRINACVVESTKSSWSELGKAASSSITSSAHLLRGAHTFPDANISATEFTLEILSFPRVGVYSCTGIPILLNSNTSGAPEALASTIQASGSHSVYISIARLFSSGNSSRSFNASNKIILASFGFSLI